MKLERVDARFAHRRSGEVVLLDNRDSFTFNLAHRFHQAGQPVVVARSDKLDAETLAAWRPSALVISPGPGHPDAAGISVEAIKRLGASVPILGICLGHQAVVRAFGGTVGRSEAPLHGQSTRLEHDGSGLFEGLEQGLDVGRYHALVADQPLPDALVANAWSDGFIMGVRHRDAPIHGLQFHPESVLTPCGLRLIERFVGLIE